MNILGNNQSDLNLNTGMNDLGILALKDANGQVHKARLVSLTLKLKDAMPKPQRVIFNGRTTIAFWPDGTKTVVKCSPDDEFDPKMGVAMAIVIKMFGSRSQLAKFIEKNSRVEMTPEQEFMRQLEKESKKIPY